jgi:probable F420-dependent oxidoreductase
MIVSPSPSASVRLVRFGLFAVNYNTCADPRAAVTVAKHAEAAGFESVWTGEHLVLPDPQRQWPFPPTMPFLDTIVALTLAAANTTTIKLGSGIIILPLRTPAVLAKELASVDVVSNGRLIVGVGAGYIPAEFAAVGVSQNERGARTDDAIRALRALWTMEQPRYDGRFTSFAGIDAHPRPAQRPCPPIIVGGESPAALRRAVTMGNGWYGFSLDVAETRELVAALRQTATEHERPPDLGRLEITVTPCGQLDRSVVAQYEDAGVDRLVLLPEPEVGRGERHHPVPLERILANVERAAAELL